MCIFVMKFHFDMMLCSNLAMKILMQIVWNNHRGCIWPMRCRFPTLNKPKLPISHHNFERKGKVILIEGISCEKTYHDTKITHLTSQSFSDMLRSTNNMKNTRRIDTTIGKSLFNPLAFTSGGGMALECAKVIERLDEKNSLTILS